MLVFSLLIKDPVRNQQIEIQICEPEDNPKIFEETVIEETTTDETASSDENSLQVKPQTKIKSIDHLKLEKSSLPTRSSSDKYSTKKNLSFENIHSYYTPEVFI